MSRRPRIIVVAKRSSIEKLSVGEIDTRARQLLKKKDPAVRKWQPAHDAHCRTLDKVEAVLSKAGAEVLILRGAQAEFDTKRVDLVVTVGGDGTLLAASHNVGDTPIIGVNSAPRHSVGFYCAAKGRSVPTALKQALAGDLPTRTLTRMAVMVNSLQRSSRVLNEALFCHSEPAATSRYILQVGRKREEHRSSGIWVGTAAGSTAAIHSAGGKILPLLSTDLQYIVREPYIRGLATANLLGGRLKARAKLAVTSKMEDARIYLDGPYRKIRVRLGDELVFTKSEESLNLLGLDARRRT